MPVRPFARPGGSFASRAFGNAVHALLEEATRRIAEGLPAEALQIELPAWESRAAAILRTEGLAPRLAARQATLVRQALENTLGDRVGRWILGARTEASSELSLTVPGEVTRRYRVDRLFRAGASPNAPGEEFRWVIDYKTASYDGHETERFLHAERTKYADQMAAYARAIGGGGIRLGLWFPMMSRLTWWAAPKVGEDRPCGQTVSPARP